MIRQALLAVLFGAWAARAWAEAASVPATPANWWAVLVLGIPLSVLAAALAGASARSLKEAAGPEQGIPKRAAGTIVDGFIGGWIAMFLIGFTSSAPYFTNVAPEVIGAFGGLLTEYVRVNGSKWWDELRDAVISRIRRKTEGSP